MELENSVVSQPVVAVILVLSPVTALIILPPLPLKK